ncbi:hypothetical protein GCM10025787_51440 [Saccharopolyspora rosea]|uniref:T7SS-secreted protein n=1 Tax=Saccharopolyspora rosea TaxID=524884 RepID=A0ABW3FVU2_9PSEU
MVSNTSSLGDDLAEAKRAISDGAHAVGVALGLVEGDVIPGDPAKMREVADHLSKLGSGFERAGQGFKAIDDGGWKGHAADQFRSYLDTCPPKWFSAADAFTSAGRAVAQYAEVLAEAKAAAQRAKEQLEKAKQTSEAARERHNAEVDAYNQRVEAANAGGPEPGPVPGPFTDPAAADREAAEQAIRDAKARVQAAGDQAARALIAACEDAPAEPGLLTKLKENFTDSLESGGRLLGSVVGGALDAVGGLVQLARMIAPFDPYKFTHPAQSAEAAATLAMGLVGAVKDPYAAIKTTVDIDGWKNQPGRTLGSCIPDAIASLAGGAGTASRVASTTRRLTKGARELGGRAAKSAGHLEPPTPHHPPVREAPTPQHLPGHDPGEAFREAQAYVSQHGDPLKLGQSDVWDLDKGADELPKGLTRQPIDNYVEDPRFVYEKLDPDKDALFRKVEAKDLPPGGIDGLFKDGVSARHPDAAADLPHLGAHVAGAAGETPFISTTNSLGHALARDGGLAEGDVILDIRAREAIHGDATFRLQEGDTFMSHGEGERLFIREIPTHQVRGAWTVVNGRPSWIPNPHFDLNRIHRGTR